MGIIRVANVQRLRCGLPLQRTNRMCAFTIVKPGKLLTFDGVCNFEQFVALSLTV
jgi:hypothetical protein